MTDHMDPSKYFVVSIREYDEMKSEIERLRSTIGGWSQDISNLEDEVEKLRGDLEDCEKDFEILSSIFNEVRTERDQLIRGATEK